MIIYFNVLQLYAVSIHLSTYFEGTGFKKLEGFLKIFAVTSYLNYNTLKINVKRTEISEFYTIVDN